jgi:hypothetical protein
LALEELMDKYAEAQILREFEVGVFYDAIVKALGGKK